MREQCTCPVTEKAREAGDITLARISGSTLLGF